MTHEDRGHYARKHAGQDKDADICARITHFSDHGGIPCALAHRVARDSGISPGQAGVQIDLLELRITACQMGLFGYGPGVKKFDPDFVVPPNLAAALENAADDGRISCSRCWQIARKLKFKKLAIGSACEKLGLRIKPCQLGAF